MAINMREEYSEALQVVSSTISKCEKIQPKFAEGTSQHTLLKNRIKAMYIAKTLITEDRDIERYSKEELIDALKPITSVISKCKTGQKNMRWNLLITNVFRRLLMRWFGLKR